MSFWSSSVWFSFGKSASTSFGKTCFFFACPPGFQHCHPGLRLVVILNECEGSSHGSFCLVTPAFFSCHPVLRHGASFFTEQPMPEHFDKLSASQVRHDSATLSPRIYSGASFSWQSCPTGFPFGLKFFLLL